MRVSVEITSSLGRKLTVVVPAQQIETRVKARLQEISKTAKLPGYRPGMLPEKIAKERFGATARNEVIQETIDASLKEAITQEKLRPAENPVMQSFKGEPGEPLEYSVTFDVMPDVELNSMQDVVLEKMTAPIEDTDVNRVLEQIRQQQMDWEPSERPAEMGDKLVVDIQKLINGVPDLGSERQNTFFVLSEATEKAGFGALKGAKKGDAITVVLPPYDHPSNPSKEPTSLRVNIHSVYVSKLPELNDEFAKKLGIKEGGLAELRNELKQQMAKELERVIKNDLREQVVVKLLERHKPELPKNMVERQYQYLIKEVLANIERQSGRKAAPEQLSQADRDQLTAMAQRRVSLTLIYASISKQHNISVEQKRINEFIGQIASQYENPQTALKTIQGNQNLLANIHNQVLEEQIVDHLLGQVQFKEKAMTYEEIMVPKQAQTHHDHESDHVHDENCNH